MPIGKRKGTRKLRKALPPTPIPPPRSQPRSTDSLPIWPVLEQHLGSDCVLLQSYLGRRVNQPAVQRTNNKALGSVLQRGKAPSRKSSNHRWCLSPPSTACFSTTQEKMNARSISGIDG